MLEKETTSFLVVKTKGTGSVLLVKALALSGVVDQIYCLLVRFE
jgi:hypothetical protein